MTKGKSKPDFVNKREIRLSQREVEDRRRIFMILGGIGALILLILAGGLIYTYTIKPAQSIATVEGTNISRGDYQKRVLYERYLIDEQMALIQAQYQQLAQSLQDSPELLQSLGDQANQQLNQLVTQRVGVDRQALDLLIEEELVKAEAARRDITVSDEEIDETYRAIAAARSGGYTEASAQETVTARQNATATAAMFTPTPTQEITGAQALSDTISVATVAPGPTPTINVIAGSDLDEAASQWETITLENAGLTPADLRELVYAQLLKQKLIESFDDEVEKTELQANARHILVDTQEEALAARVRLDAGETFEDVAAEVSTDTGSAAQGGDLGWFGPGVMIEPFNSTVFSMTVGSISDPIESQFGWHIIELLAREDRELNESSLIQARNRAYGEWLQEARSLVNDSWSVTDAPPDNNNPFAAPPQ